MIASLSTEITLWVGIALLIAAGIIVGIILRRRKSEQPQVKKDEQQNALRIEVRSCKVCDFYPFLGTEFSTILGHMNTVVAEVKFYPKGEIRLQALELHMGRHPFFDAKRLPVIILDHDDTYPIEFEVPNKILTGHFEGKPKKAYIRARYDDKGCRSNEFPISLLYEVDEQK